MAEWHRRLIGLGLPCLLLWLLDVSLTLHGQPPGYWAGDYSRTTESAPFYRRLYKSHPAAGVAGNLLVLSLVGGLLVLLPEPLAVVVALVAAFGSTWGASTWVERHLAFQAAWGQPSPVSRYQAVHALFLTTAVLAGAGIRWVVRSSALGPAGPARRTGQQWALLLLLAAALSALVFGPW